MNRPERAFQTEAESQAWYSAAAAGTLYDKMPPEKQDQAAKDLLDAADAYACRRLNED